MMKTAYMTVVLLSFGTLFLFQQGMMETDPIVTVTALMILEELDQIPNNVSNNSDVSDFIQYLKEDINTYILNEEPFPFDALLFSANNTKEGYNLKPSQESLNHSTFNRSLPTTFLIHGYDVQLEKSSVFFDIKDQLLEAGKYNAIVVNWTRFNGPPYAKACANGVIVGLKLSNLTHYIMNNTGISPKSIYAVGHSLGAQIAGYFGKSTKDLGRISGLDAAGPVFESLNGKLRLSYSDALFVDGMHTNGAYLVIKGLGTIYPYADIDFYPNGGSKQPGCRINGTYQDTNNQTQIITGDAGLLSCSHDRAPYLYYASINDSKCSFTSVFCGNYTNYLEEKCPFQSSITNEMGFHAKPMKSVPKESTFYLRTAANPPYCINTEISSIA